MAVAREGPKLYEWISTHGQHARLDEETIDHLLGSVALACTNALGYLGRSGDWNVWFGRALSQFRQTISAGPWLAMLDFARLIRLHSERSYALVAEEVEAIVERFAQLSMKDKVVKALFLQASNLKELGRSSEALLSLQHVRNVATAAGDDATLALSLTAMSELYGAAGQFEDAMTVARAAASSASISGCPWIAAYLQGTIGELLRDRSDYTSAAFAYRAAATKYTELGMDSFAAYTRVLLAETLLLAGYEEDAVSELLEAAPVIKRENLTREAIVALGLLREAIRHQHASPEALRELREQLTRMKEEGRL